MPKIKLKTNINTNKSDNTTIKPFIKDLRTVDKKKKDLEDYKKSQRFGKAVQNIIGQTALDQVDFSYTQGLKNTPKSFNLGTKLNTTNDINDINSYNNKYLGVINAGLNTLKVPAPIVGDAAINTLQEGIQYYDEENPTELSKIKNLPQNVQDQIVNKPFGYNYSFAKGGKIPIKVSDPNDPRLRAYNDSLSLYNKGKSYLNQPYSNNLYNYAQDLLQFGYSRKIAPGKSKKGISDLMIPQYKKPVQPYIYEKPNNVVKSKLITKPIYQEQQFQPDIVNTVSPQVKSKFYQGYDFMQQTGLRNGDYTEQQVQEAMNNKGTKKLSNIYKFGGQIPKYGMGAQVGSTGASMIPGYGTAISAGLNIGGMYNDSVMNEYGNYKTQSDKNMSYFNPAANFDRIANGDVGRGILGGLTGPFGGAILESTGAMDAMFGKSQGQITEEKNKESKIQFGNYKNIFGKGDNSTLGIKTNNQSMYANGGMKVISNNHFNPTEEVEGGETAQLPNEENIEFNGPTHEQGGIKTNLPEGTRIFSDRLKFNNKTFAQIAKPIQSKISKLDNKPTSKALENTKMLFNKQLDNVFNEQETLKQEQEMKKNIFAFGGMKKYAEGGPTVGRINPKTGTPFTPYEVALYHQSSLPGSFGQEYTGESNNGNRSFQPIPKANMGKTPLTSFKRNVNQNPNWQEPLVYSQPKPQYVPSNNNQANYEAGTKTPEGQFYMNNNVPNYGSNIKQATEDFNNVGLADRNAIKGLSTNSNNWSEIGAGLTGLAGMVGQIRNNNNIKAPNAFQNVYLGNGPRPDMVDYSAELNGINNEFNSAKQGLRLGSGSYSTQVGNLGKMRADQLNARGKVMQGQENANTQLMNEYKNRVAENANKSQLMNFEIGKENEYNRLGYDQWKTKNNNEAIANATQIGTNIFNNRTGYNNQMEQAKIMANSKDGTVFNDTSFNTNFEKQYYNQLNPTQKAQHNARRQQKGLEPLEFRNGGIVKTKIKR